MMRPARVPNSQATYNFSIIATFFADVVPAEGIAALVGEITNVGRATPEREFAGQSVVLKSGNRVSIATRGTGSPPFIDAIRAGSKAGP
jgi:hypothetical protein